jgi:hypothetical protein
MQEEPVYEDDASDNFAKPKKSKKSKSSKKTRSHGLSDAVDTPDTAVCYSLSMQINSKACD